MEIESNKYKYIVFIITSDSEVVQTACFCFIVFLFLILTELIRYQTLHLAFCLNSRQCVFSVEIHRDGYWKIKSLLQIVNRFQRTLRGTSVWMKTSQIVSSIHTQGNKISYYRFLGRVTRQKRGVDFCNTPRTASSILVLTLGTICPAIF